jgi:hypothetical protein
LVRLFAFSNRDSFDRIRRQPLRQLVGECLILRRFALLRGPFHFCQQWIFPTNIKTPLVSAKAVGGRKSASECP